MNSRKSFNVLLLVVLSLLINGKSFGQLPCTITLDSNPTCGGITSGGGAYEPGVTVNISVTPLDSYQFVNWVDANGVVYNINQSFSITAVSGEEIRLTAVFTLIWKKSGEDIYYNGGKVGIGTEHPDKELTVNGMVHTSEVLVSAVGADFVFEDDYKLRTLEEVENYINENKHLPEIASAMEMKQNGVELGDMGTKLLQKIEELTLYAIELKKKNKELSEKIEAMKKEKRLPDNVFQK